jgi:hypothetical protein
MPICLSEAEYYYGLGSHDDYDFPTITTKLTLSRNNNHELICADVPRAVLR